MKAQISRLGMLELLCESDLEFYAAKQWLKDNPNTTAVAILDDKLVAHLELIKLKELENWDKAIKNCGKRTKYPDEIPMGGSI